MSVNVYVVGRPGFDVETFLAFLRDEGVMWQRTPSATPAEELVEAAGRVCYMSFGKHQSPRTNAEYVRHLVEMGHESVLEHVNWTFVVTGVSRAFSHQLVRHRVGFAFSQLSQQYHDETDAQFLRPAQLEQFPRVMGIWDKAVQKAQEAYKDILEALGPLEKEAALEADKREIRRAIRSAARSVLPQATETKIMVTANARAIRYFLRVRGAIPGDEEMRRVSAELLKVVHTEAPSMFSDFCVESLSDGSPIVKRLGSELPRGV